MMQLAKFISKNSKAIIIAVLLITILGATQIKNLKVEDDITKYLSENDPEIEFYQNISEKFDKYDENLTLVSIEYNELFTLENLNNFKAIIEQIEKSDYVVSVNSFLNMPKITATDYGLEVNEFVEHFPETEKEVIELKKDALNDDLIRGSYLSPDGEVGLLMIESPDNVNGASLHTDLENIINRYNSNISRVEFFGIPIMEKQITEMALNNISLAIIAALVIIILLYYCFRSTQGTFLPIMIALLTSLWILSSVAIFGRAVTIVISAIPILMLSLVTAYGIHFISRYYEERNSLSPQDAVEKTIEFVFIPIFMSALTTMAGFASLVTAVVRPMTEFGVFATIGIFIAFLLVVFLLGAIFSAFIPKKIPDNFSYHANDIVTRILRNIASSVINKRKLLIGIISSIVIISVAFSFQVKSDSSVEDRLGPNNPITKTMEYFKEKFGGVDFLYVYIEADNVKHPYVLRSIDKIQNYSKRLPSLSQPSSITSFLGQLNNAMENREIIPANPDKINNLWFFAGENEYINSLIVNDDKNTILQIRSKEMTSTVVDQSIQKMEKFIRQIPLPVKVVCLDQLSPEEREQYYPYIIEDIIMSWQANGNNLDNVDVLRKELIRLAKLPVERFVQSSNLFVNEVLSLSSLELEDFGIPTAIIQPIILNYLGDYPDKSSFLESLSRQLEIPEEDSEYLKNIIDSSIYIAAEREKISYAEKQVNEILYNELEKKDAEYLWYLTDDYAYIPDKNGEVNFTYRLTGIPVITNQVNNSVFRGQINSMITAFTIVGLLLILQFGSVIIGLVAMIPILLTILTSFGVMGIADISLNIGTMMVASIAIGAGIDYTIHFINRYKQELIKNNEPVKAIKITLAGTGRAIVFNSVSVAAGCFILAFSEIQMISQFAKLIGSVMLISVVYTLLLLPILLNSIKFKEEKNVKQK